jgi:hypothetical protein
VGQGESTRTAAPPRVVHVVEDRLAVAVQVAFERQTLKPGFHLIGARVETRRLSAMGQGESTCTKPRLAHHHEGVKRAVEENVPVDAAVRLRRALQAQPLHQRVAVQVDPFESKGLKPGFTLDRFIKG